MSYIAPAGTPLNLADLAAGLGAGLARRSALEELRALLIAHSGQGHCWPVASGRAAMTVILRAMSDAAADPRRRVVIIPGYTCYSVPAAIERAGLVPRLVDVNPRTLDVDLDQLRRMDYSEVLAIITANLYGIPNSLAEIEAIAAANGVYMLDDSAQGLGAACGGRAVGGFGDAGLYSFDKGKNITTMQGGAILGREGALARALRKHCENLPGPSGLDALSYALQLALYGVLLRPAFYDVVRRVPGLGLGTTRYETRYPVTGYSPALAGLALRLARRLHTINAKRIEIARGYQEALQDVPCVRLPQIASNSAPVFTRFPLFATSPQERARIIDALNADGIGATTSYPSALVDVPEVGRALHGQRDSQQGAQAVAATIVTLPTHAYCPANLPERVRAILERVAHGSRR